MRKLKKVAILIISGLILEMLCFLYLNNVFLNKKAVATFKDIKTAIKDKKIFSITNKISNIKMSDDDKYAVYESDGKLEAYDIKNKSEINIQMDAGAKVLTYDYMPYEDKLFMLQNTSGAQYYIVIYDLITKKELNRICVFEMAFLGGKIQGNLSEVKTSSGIEGFLIKESNGANGEYINYYGQEAEIYSTFIDFPKIKINNFFPLSGQGCFVIQNADTKEIDTINIGHIYMFTGKTPNFISSEKAIKKVDTTVKEPELLYVDGRDGMYIGAMKGDKITEIEYKNDKNSKKYILKKPTKESNIKFLQDESIYAVEQGQVRNLKNNKITKINGSFIQMQANKIFYKKGKAVMEKDINWV